MNSRSQIGMYEKPPETFAELIAPYPAEIKETAKWLRTLILREFPQVEENVYGGAKVGNALYSIGGADKVALGIMPGSQFVKLFIHDHEHLGETTFRLKGRGKHMRHIKFSAPPVAQRDELLALARVPIRRRS